MTALLELKERLKKFYSKYSTYLIPVLKFILALVFFMNINSTLGFMEQLNSVFIVLILALVCSLLPFSVTVVLGFLLMLGHCYAVGIEVAGFALVLLLLLLVLFLRFVAKDAGGLILTPLSFSFGIPSVVPIGTGLLRTPVASFSSVCGIIIYYFMMLVQEKASLLQGMENDEIPKKLQILLDGIIKNQVMWLAIIAFLAVSIVVYCIRRMSINHAWEIAITAGCVLYLLIMIGGGLFMDIKSSVVLLCIQVVVAFVLAMILKFFAFNVDYTRIEYLQYDDDDYYYYVKAVPKVAITQQKRSVKTISEEVKPAKPAKPAKSPVKEAAVKPPVKETPVVEVQPPLEETLESRLTESLKDL